MILITGATGHLGRVVIEHLLSRGHAGQVAALIRDEGKASDLKAQGVDVRVGNYDDAVSLDAALEGVERVLLISGTERDPAKSLHQHANVIDAAKRSGVRFIAYTGRAMKKPSDSGTELMKGHFHTEDLIRSSGITYALFRNALYLESITYFIGKGVTFDTDIRLPTGDGKVAFALRTELGEGIANALHHDAREDRIHTLTASEAWSFADVARTLSELSGNPVTYCSLDEASFQAQMSERGLPEAMTQLFSGFYRDIREGQLDEVTPELEELLGRKPASLKVGLRELYNL